MLNLAMQLHSKTQGSYTTDVVTLGSESILLELFFFNNFLARLEIMLFIFWVRRRDSSSYSHEFTFNFCILTNIIALCMLNDGGRY